MGRMRFGGVLALVMTAVLALPAAAIYDSRTPLSGPMEAFANVNATGWHLSADGEWVVFRADLLVDGRTDAWASRLDGSTPTPIHLNAGATFDNVTDVMISPDSAFVVVEGDLTGVGTSLYSRRIDGTGSLVRLNDPPPAGGGVAAGAITPDSQYVVWTGEMDVDDVREVYGAPIHTSGEQIQLSDDPVLGGEVTSLFVRISPDSSHVVYHGDLNVVGTVELYSARIGEAMSETLLNSPIGLDGDVATDGFGPVITPDSSHVVYYGDLDVDEQFDVYAAPIDSPGGEVLLSEGTGGSLNTQQLYITEDSTTVVYRGDFEAPGWNELFAAPLDGSGHQRLSTTGLPGAHVDFHRIVGDHVVYAGALSTGGVVDLYTRPITGSTDQQRKLTTVAGTGSGVPYGYFQISPDGNHVVFPGVMGNASDTALWSVPLVGGTQVRLSDAPVTGGEVDPLRWRMSEDSRRVIFLGDLLADERFEWFSAPIGTADSQTLVSGPVVAGGDVGVLAYFAPDASFVVFVGDLVTDEQVEMFASGAGQLPPLGLEGVAVAGITDTSATITWDAPTDGGQVTGFDVTLDPPAATGAPGRTAAATAGPNATSIQLGQLNPDVDYTATVTAVNDAGFSPPSTVMFTTLPAGGVIRLAGDTRYETAAGIALERFDPADVDIVYLATGTNFPDALAGGPLAAAQGAPILLATQNGLPDATENALAELDPDLVIALGGTAALSDAVLAAAGTAASATTDRIAGDNRYETAAAIAARVPASNRVFLATGTNFPDALTGGPATDGAPILLATPTALPSATATALADRAPAVVVALGGTSALADAVVADAADRAGGATWERLSGLNRFETATTIADTLATPDTVYIAVAGNFPDALAGGPAAAAEGAPILLTSTAELTEATRTWLESLPDLRRIVILGGEGAIAPAVATTLESLLD